MCICAYVSPCARIWVYVQPPQYVNTCEFVTVSLFFIQLQECPISPLAAAAAATTLYVTKKRNNFSPYTSLSPINIVNIINIVNRVNGVKIVKIVNKSRFGCPIAPKKWRLNENRAEHVNKHLYGLYL